MVGNKKGVSNEEARRNFLYGVLNYRMARAPRALLRRRRMRRRRMRRHRTRHRTHWARLPTAARAPAALSAARAR